MLIEPVVDVMHKQSAPSRTMNKLCRQLSIDSPGQIIKDCVFNFEVAIPEVPPNGARIRVVCAGACYQNRHRTYSNSSSSSGQSDPEESNFAHHGIKDGALFPGFEVSGIVDELGADVAPTESHFVGQRVVLYPYDGITQGYAEYIVVPELMYLVPIPNDLPLSVAAMLPSGALLAKNAVLAAHVHVKELLKERPHQDVRILIVGTGGLALWAIRIAAHHFRTSEHSNRVKVTVASLRDEGFQLAKELHDVNLVQWNEHLYESQIIERTIDACDGCVDIVIDFGMTLRSLQRSLKCLNDKGVVLVNEEVADRLLPRYSLLGNEKHLTIEPVKKGTVQQLEELVQYVTSGEIVPPPHSEFPADDAMQVIQKLCESKIPGRAILRFHDVK